MKECFVKAETLPEAYHQALSALMEEGEVVDCPAWNTRCREIALTMAVEKPLQEPRISRVAFMTPEALDKYLGEMLEGSLDWAVAAGKEPYTYHDRMVNYGGVDQLAFALEDLKRDPQSRRAVVLVRNGLDIGSADPACLQHLQFSLHGGALDLQILFRSNDACKACFMNAFALSELQRKMAEALGVPVGTYTHRANSFHAYESDWKMLEGAAKRISEGKRLTFTYEAYKTMKF